jgi:hypothetical protein
MVKMDSLLIQADVTALFDPSPSRKALTTDVDTLRMWKEQTNHFGNFGGTTSILGVWSRS